MTAALFKRQTISLKMPDASMQRYKRYTEDEDGRVDQTSENRTSEKLTIAIFSNRNGKLNYRMYFKTGK